MTIFILFKRSPSLLSLTISTCRCFLSVYTPLTWTALVIQHEWMTSPNWWCRGDMIRSPESQDRWDRLQFPQAWDNLSLASFDSALVSTISSDDGEGSLMDGGDKLPDVNGDEAYSIVPSRSRFDLWMGLKSEPFPWILFPLRDDRGAYTRAMSNSLFISSFIGSQASGQF